MFTSSYKEFLIRVTVSGIEFSNTCLCKRHVNGTCSGRGPGRSPTPTVLRVSRTVRRLSDCIYPLPGGRPSSATLRRPSPGVHDVLKGQPLSGCPRSRPSRSKTLLLSDSFYDSTVPDDLSLSPFRTTHPMTRARGE